MGRPIGYYVHHHGDGHRQRGLAIAEASDSDIVLLGTGLECRTRAIRCIDLPDDRTLDAGFSGADATFHRPKSLHYAPLDHEGVRQRMTILANWMARERPSLIIVDVSVEIAMLARLMSVPTVYVRLAGLRDDEAHLDAFRGAQALLAPFSEELDDSAIPRWVRDKTSFIPGLTGGTTTLAASLPGDILVVLGRGGTSITADQLAAAARATPDRQWVVAGDAPSAHDMPSNLNLLGWIPDIDAAIGKAKVIIGGAGDGLMSSVLAASRPYVCLPEARPFDEQQSKARRLAELGAAIVLPAWPCADAWKAMLARAEALDGCQALRLHDPAGARKAAQFLTHLADNRDD